jgi:4-hydroxy-tetrahydrodipicolinate synthase
MKERYVLDGIVPSLNTPFDDRDKIDLASLTRLIEHHLAEGAVGFLTTAQAAEVFELSVEERITIIRLVRDVTKGRAKVIVGTTSHTQSESAALAKAAVAAGCDGVLIEVPPLCKGDFSRTIAFFDSFAQLGMEMLMIQDLDWSGTGMDITLIRELFELIEPFQCLKVEVNPAGPKYSEVIEATNNRLHVSGGWASLQLIEALDRGVSAFMPTALTGLFARAIDCYRAGNRDGAKQWFHAALPILAFTRQHLDTSIAFHKTLYYRRGIFSTPRVRKPITIYDSYHKRYADELLLNLRQVERELAAEVG